MVGANDVLPPPVVAAAADEDCVAPTVAETVTVIGAVELAELVEDVAVVVVVVLLVDGSSQ